MYDMMLQVIKNGGCNKIDPSIYPRHDDISRRFSDLEEREKCREYWKQAESTIVATLPGAVHEEFKEAYRIKINHLYCYKEELSMDMKLFFLGCWKYLIQNIMKNTVYSRRYFKVYTKRVHVVK